MSIEAPARRVRRSPEAARANILAAAERLLLATGPQALKLTDVAAEAGVSHAVVVHHFGSVSEVHAALMELMVRQLVDQILSIRSHAVAGGQAADAELQALFAAFESRGAARLAAWLELTGQAHRMTRVADAVEKVLAEQASRDQSSPVADSDFLLLCVTLALGVGLFGPALESLLGKAEGRARGLALAMLRREIAGVAPRG